MRTRTPRKFTILDGMILVAAVALGFAIRRAAEEMIAQYSFNNYYLYRTFPYRLIEAVVPFLATFTLGVLAMRLRRPRPRWRPLLRQPGMAASVAATIPIAMALYDLWTWMRFLDDPEASVAEGSVAHATYGFFIDAPTLGELYGAYGTAVGAWVLGAWLILALSGRLRAEKSGIDRLGRLVGLAWLSIPPIRVVVSFII